MVMGDRADPGGVRRDLPLVPEDHRPHAGRHARQDPLLDHFPRHLRDLSARCTTSAFSACRAATTRYGDTNFIPESAHALNECDHDRGVRRRRRADRVPLQPGLAATSRASRPAAIPGAPRRSSGRRRTRRPSTATGARSCRSSIAGPTTTACRAQGGLHPAERAAERGPAEPRTAARSTEAVHDLGARLHRAAHGRHRLVAVAPDAQRAAVGGAAARRRRARGRAGHGRRRKTALWVFLAVATSLFALFVSAYMRMRTERRLGLDAARRAAAAAG